MRINRGDLDAAAEGALISQQQATALWGFLQQRLQSQPGFHMAHILYYLGGLVAIAAMSLFIGLAWESFGGWGLMIIAILYMMLGVGLTEYLLQRKLVIPAGLTAALAIALTPLAVYGLQQALGFWAEGEIYQDYHRHIDWRWMLMELATLAVGAVALWRYRLSFLIMPVAVTLWYMSMDLAPFLFGTELDWELRRQVSLWFGLGIVVLALGVDIRLGRRPDYGFWLYLFGVMAFWSGLTLQDSGSELGKFLYCLLNLGMLGMGAVLRRRVFAVFGGLGIAAYLGHLANEVFQDSLLFPVALSFIGLGIIGLGILWQRHEERLGLKLRGWLPPRLRTAIEEGG